MINNIVAYDLREVTKKQALSKAKSWYKAGLIENDKWIVIQAKYQSNLYTPKILMRVFLFCITVLGISTLSIPLGFMFQTDSEAGIRMLLFIIGIAAVIFTENKIIKSDNHFRSGVTEAGYYVGLAFIYFGILGFEINDNIVYFLVAFIFLAAATVRYLDIVSLAFAVFSLIGSLFFLFQSSLAFFPFTLMILFAGLYLASQQLQKRVILDIWEDHFIVFDTLSLLLFYFGGNYFVVRELSVEMTGLSLAAGEDIPFAFLFYSFTFLIPMVYLAYGLIKRKVIFIRVSLLTISLAVLTLQYYYFNSQTEITVTIIGAFMIFVALTLMKYLKVNRKGYTREQILSSKWDNSDLVAFVASQTLGGHQIDTKVNTKEGMKFGGGSFGGGGASSEF